MPQPFILLKLVEDDGAQPRRISVNAAHIQFYGKWATSLPGSDYREGVVNAIVTLANGNALYVRETPAEIQSLLAAV